LLAERSLEGGARAASSDAEGRMPEASVRRDGTGGPELARGGPE